MRKYLDFYPHLVKEFDLKKNSPLRPKDLSYGSNKKVWWKCIKGHEWNTTFYNRFRTKENYCPTCNSLNFVFPNIAKEWHPTKNGNLTSEDVTKHSGKKVWWKCLKGHEWKTRVASRTQRIKYKSHTNIGTACPYCSNKKASKENNLTVLYPKLSQEWHPTKNEKLTPQQVTKGYDKKVWWICSSGHEWEATPNNRTTIIKKKNRTYFGSNCPFCSGLRVTPDKTIKVLFPELVKQWHPTKNADLKPEHFSKSSNKKIWWFCSNGHEWKTGIAQRTMGQNCPKCSFQSSKPEFRILSELETLFKKVDSRYKFKKAEIDVFIQDINVGIEYDGSYYHKNKESRDRKKNKFLNKHSIKLIRVRKIPLKKLDNYDVIVQQDELNKKDLNRIVNSIYNFCNKEQKILINKYLKHKSFINNKSYNKYLSYFPAPIPQKSLASFNNKFVKEWNYKKNYPLKPEFFSRGSASKVWWLCSKGHEWEMPIKSRTKNNKEQNCPYCSGHRIDEKNNLKFLMPSLVKEWHPVKNDHLKPEQFSKSSNEKVWWLCSNGHEWKTGINNRYNGTNCPYCFKSKIKFTRVSSTNNFKVLMPNLAKEWHPTKNNNLKPEQVPKYSSIKVWWLCSKGHEWKTKIRYRSTGNNCPDCYNIKRKFNSKS